MHGASSCSHSHSRSRRVLEQYTQSESLDDGRWRCLRWLHLVDPPEIDKTVTSMVEQTLREERRTLRQSAFSNQFMGSARLESAFNQCTSQLQLRKVQRRLLICSAVLLYETLYVLIAPEHANSTLALKSVHGLAPFALVLAAGVSLSFKTFARFWRPIVISATLISYILVSFTMLRLESETHPHQAADPEQVGLYQLAWLLIYSMVVAINSALDFMLIALTCLAMHISFWVLIGTGCGFFGPDAAPIAGIEVQCATEVAAKTLGLSTVGGMLLLFGARRINRFERLSFVRSFLQQQQLDEDAGMLAGKWVEVLGIFADPKLTKRQQRELGLQPLRLGQELKFLMRAIPRVFLELVPAATFEDARASILHYKARIVIFSGHTFAQTLGISSLAFEEDNSGRMDLQSSPEHFLALLAEATSMPGCKLECIFLNACLTLPLALAVLRHLPQLQLICWSSITEDSAARYFSSGFAEAIGEDLKEGLPPDIRRAFLRGCSVFRSVGCSFGNPQPYLDAGETVPPVQGDVVLLTCSSTNGAVLAWRLDDSEQDLAAEVIDDGTGHGAGNITGASFTLADGRTHSSADFALAQFALSAPTLLPSASIQDNGQRDNPPLEAETHQLAMRPEVGAAAQLAATISC